MLIERQLVEMSSGQQYVERLEGEQHLSKGKGGHCLPHEVLHYYVIDRLWNTALKMQALLPGFVTTCLSVQLSGCNIDTEARVILL